LVDEKGKDVLPENKTRTITMPMEEKCCEATLLMRIVIMSLYWMGVLAASRALA
jgi:hypothetical protein